MIDAGEKNACPFLPKKLPLSLTGSMKNAMITCESLPVTHSTIDTHTHTHIHLPCEDHSDILAQHTQTLITAAV